MLNNVSIMGRLVRDPEFRQTTSGIPVCSFTLAVDRNFLNKGTGERDADYIDVTVWRGLAEFVARNFEKGDSVVLEGQLKSENWTDKDNRKHHSVYVVANNVYFGERKRASGPVGDFDPDNDGIDSSEDEDPLPF